MNTGIEIGNNQCFRLTSALLVYKRNRYMAHNSSDTEEYVTVHDVDVPKDGVPTLGPACPITETFVNEICRNIAKIGGIEILPENILAKDRATFVWWVPAQIQQMYFREGENPDLKGLSGHKFPQPALAFMVNGRSLSVRALNNSERPSASTPLAIAPYWNVGASGGVCLGTARTPTKVSVSTIPQWEKCFFESEFTHPSDARNLTKIPGGFTALWRSLKGKRTFPSESLVQSGETLEKWIMRN